MFEWEMFIRLFAYINVKYLTQPLILRISVLILTSLMLGVLSFITYVTFFSVSK
jgi:hypothetical protein